MSSSTFTYTSISSDYEELSDVVYVPKPEYPEYLVPSDAEEPIEDQPIPDDALPTTLSPRYIADFDLKEDLKEDHTDYPVDEGDDVDDEPSDNEDDDDDDVECYILPRKKCEERQERESSQHIGIYIEKLQHA
uniref:Uncharacterized protein n=1 Tax=Tanacetum cinerariifolium TaxID=118510 RepID=A0A6L2MFL8_TANCI|nr:hypothetical protein [Tanacetum cinerariifolium]